MVSVLGCLWLSSIVCPIKEHARGDDVAVASMARMVWKTEASFGYTVDFYASGIGYRQMILNRTL